MGISVMMGWHISDDARLSENALLNERAIEASNVKMLRNVTYSDIAPLSQMDIIMPKNIKKGDKLPLIMWTHGGGFIAGDKRHKNPYLAQIAEKGFIVANINYALAPGNQYPTPILQELAAAKFLKKNDHQLPIDFTQIIIGGDSAGAQIASQFAAMHTNNKLMHDMQQKPVFKANQLKAVVLFGGLYNMQTVRATKFPRIELFMESYTGEKHWEKQFKPIEQLSTTANITKRYPPTFLTVGDADPFDSQAHELVKVLKASNVPYAYSFFDDTHGLRHQYQFHMELKESRLTYRKLMMFLGNHTSQSPYSSNTVKEKIPEIKIKQDKN
ncbi:lipase [Macrococcus epidermidis]|uniref:Lipase n=2 Tax=Macrococcus epidermidis TaxID=1902580 RepID=A0A327ZXZ5_9STAP|nr:lipase [Macrococcus epidermidis]